MLQIFAWFLGVPEDLIISFAIVLALAFGGVFGLLSLVSMAVDIRNEDS